MNTIFATKKHMSQVFTTDGVRLPVTVLSSGIHTVTQIKTTDRDGYWAVQLGFGTRKTKNLTKPQLGHIHAAIKGASKEENKAPKFLREVRLVTEAGQEIGAHINPTEILEPGDLVKVTGVSKGKGFAGGVKRHGFHGGPKTHGQSDRHRAPGSIGQTTTPGRVYKGKRMAGRMGGVQKTIKNLIVLSVNGESGEILVSGLVPGSRGTFLTLTKMGKSKKKYELVGMDSPVVTVPVLEEETVVTEPVTREENQTEEVKSKEQEQA